MRRVIQLEPGQVTTPESDVLARIGVPHGAPVSQNVSALMRESAALIVLAARPRAVVQPLSHADFLEIFEGEGRNAVATPLDEIVPRAEALALFVATIGAAASGAIEALFGDGDPAMAVMLDAYASEMTSTIVNELARRFAQEVREDARVLPYSPGYCGWHVSGQRALFAAIRPAEIEVSLKPSFLMTPLKSVSGVLVAGDAKTHRFRPRWTFCDECIGRDCGPRMASVQ